MHVFCTDLRISALCDKNRKLRSINGNYKEEKSCIIEPRQSSRRVLSKI